MEDFDFSNFQTDGSSKGNDDLFGTVINIDFTSKELDSTNKTQANIQLEEWEKAVNLLLENGYDAKVFCLTSSNSNLFTVKSDKWDWLISPAKGTDYIPEIFLNGVRLLLDCGIDIKKIALAKPIPKESAPEVVIQEVLQGLKQVINTISLTLIIMFSGLKNIFSELIQTNNPTLLELPDPVLIVLIQDRFWIEIGRWE